MNILDAIKYPFSGQQWLGKMTVGMMLMFIPVVGWIIVAGYGIRVANQITHQRRRVPEWDRFGQDFANGLYITIGSLIYALPIIVFVFMTLFVGWLGGSEVLLILGCFISILLGLYTFLIMPLYFSALAWYSRTQDFIEFFNIPDRIRDLTENLENLFSLWLSVLILLILLAVPAGTALLIALVLLTAPLAGLCLMIVLIFPIAFAFAALSLSTYHLVGQWGQLVIRKRT